MLRDIMKAHFHYTPPYNTVVYNWGGLISPVNLGELIRKPVISNWGMHSQAYYKHVAAKESVSNVSNCYKCY